MIEEIHYVHIPEPHRGESVEISLRISLNVHCWQGISWIGTWDGTIWSAQKYANQRRIVPDIPWRTGRYVGSDKLLECLRVMQADWLLNHLGLSWKVGMKIQFTDEAFGRMWRNLLDHPDDVGLRGVMIDRLIELGVRE